MNGRMPDADTMLGAGQTRCWHRSVSKRQHSLEHEGKIQVFLAIAKVDGSWIPGARNMEKDVALPQQAPQHHQPAASLKLKGPGTWNRTGFKLRNDYECFKSSISNWPLCNPGKRVWGLTLYCLSFACWAPLPPFPFHVVLCKVLRDFEGLCCNNYNYFYCYIHHYIYCNNNYNCIVIMVIIVLQIMLGHAQTYQGNE